MPKVSVVVPVYNTGRYIARCLDSVQAQTFDDFEILCIDDGSTDNTPDILRERARKDGRLRVVTLPENHGVPYARNLALDEAGGEYVYYMDSDDWIDPGYLEAMYSRAERTGQDVVINGNWYLEYDDPSLRKHCGRFGFVNEEAGYYAPVLVQSRFFPVVWARLYRLSYLKDNDIRFPLLKGGVEDNYFTAMAEILQERSYIFNGPFYHYYQREGSLVRQPDAVFHHMENFRVFLDTLHERKIAPSRAKRFYVMENLTVDTEERFEFLRSYFTDVRQDVTDCPRLYYPFDVYVMNALTSCRDYGEFRKRFHPLLKVSFMARIARTGALPTVEQILDGSWTV